MTPSRKLVVISGSERKPVRGARLIHNAHPDQTIEVSVRIRSKAEAKREELKRALEKPGFKQMSRADFEKTHGADPADLEKIKRFTQEYGLKVHETGTELARRTVLLSGTVRDLENAFNVELKEYSHPKGNFRGRVGVIKNQVIRRVQVGEDHAVGPHVQPVEGNLDTAQGHRRVNQ